MMSNTEKFILPPHICSKIDDWILRYPPEQKQSGVFEALRLMQLENKGFLTLPILNAVADYLNMPRIAVYEVATFFTMFRLNPHGRFVIELCTNVSCMLNGAEDLFEYLKEKLNIDANQISEDGLFTIKEVECLGACINPPVAQIGTAYHEGLTKEKLDRLIASLKEEANHAQ